MRDVQTPPVPERRHRAKQQAARDAALLALAYTRGLSAGELCELRRDDFEPGKGGLGGVLTVDGRRLPVSGQTLEILTLWRRLHAKHTDRLFYAFGEKFDLRDAISPSGLRDVTQAWRQDLTPPRASPPTGVNLQNMRKSFAALLRAEGAQENLVREALGKRSRREGPAPDLEVALRPYLEAVDRKTQATVWIPTR